MNLRAALPFTLLALPLAAGCTPKSRYAKKAAKIACDKFKECEILDDLFASYDECLKQTEDSTQEAIDMCDDYKGGLAYKCLQDAKKASCDDTSSSDACDEFNDKCGFNTGQAIVEYDNGMTVYGLMDFEFSGAASTED